METVKRGYVPKDTTESMGHTTGWTVYISRVEGEAVMNRSEAMQIIKEENLKRYNWFHTHAVRPNEVLIENLGERWCVSAADERACIDDTSRVYFDNEEDALDRFIRLLRLGKKLDTLTFRQ